MSNGITIREIIRRFERALNIFLENDLHLLQFDVNERAITHKLAEYLQPLFDNRKVDCEYNRNGHHPKEVNLPDRNNPNHERTSSIYPDIIVHERGTNDYNTLIIEAKKTRDIRSSEEARDRCKLIAYAAELRYTVGIFIVFDTNDSMNTWCRYITYYDHEWHDEVFVGEHV
jgi:hypothetical protein